MQIHRPRKMALEDDVKLEDIILQTKDGLSGADIKAIYELASSLAMRGNRNKVTNYTYW